MTNREALGKLTLYEMMCRMNKGLSDVNSDICILDALNGYEATSSYCYRHSCDKCIADWLDEEYEEGAE